MPQTEPLTGIYMCIYSYSSLRPHTLVDQSLRSSILLEYTHTQTQTQTQTQTHTHTYARLYRSPLVRICGLKLLEYEAFSCYCVRP